MKKQYALWVQAGKPRSKQNMTYQRRIKSKRECRRQVKIEQAIRNEAEKQLIMETRTKDPKLFHLVRNRRSIGGNSLLELNVGDNTYTGQNEIIDGFREHFEVLMNPEGGKNELKDRDYHTNVDFECLLIAEIARAKDIPPATTNELQKAIKSINRGKSADIYGITIEHLIYAGGNMEDLILRLINSIFKTGQIPDILKVGLLNPLFKNKGDKNNSTNYQGITVMPTISKIMETILRERIAPIVIAAQNPVQRGFTKPPPMNASLLVEEMNRDVLNTR
jgi:hypothetical protein